MPANKTTETNASVTDYLNEIADEQRRKDCTTLVKLITRHTGIKPKMWGAAIIGYGSYSYKYESGHEGTAPMAGLSSRTNAITIYVALTENREHLVAKLGKVKSSKACIYVKKLEDIDTDVLLKMVDDSISFLEKKYPSK